MINTRKFSLNVNFFVSYIQFTAIQNHYFKSLQLLTKSTQLLAIMAKNKILADENIVLIGFEVREGNECVESKFF